MSLSLIPLKLTQSLDPVTQINNARNFCVNKGGSDVYYTSFPTSGNATSSQNTINCNPDSRDTLVDRKIWMQNTFDITITGTPVGATLMYQPGISGAPRAFPLSSCIRNLSVKIGDNSVSTPLNEYFTAFERYSSEVLLQDRDYSTTPSMPDQWQNYADGNGANNNPLAFYGVNSAQCPRGGFVISVTSNTTSQAVLRVTFTEAVYLSPLWAGHGDRSGLIGIDNLTVNYTYSDLSRLWSQSVSTGAISITAPTSISVFAVSANILLKQIKPRLVEPIPARISYPLHTVTPYNNGTPLAIPALGVATMSIGNITLDTIPTRMYVFCRQQNSDLTYLSSDTFASINNITVQWGSRQLLATASQQDLYQMSVRNGCNMSFPQWSNYCGSVLAIDFAKDIGLSSIQAPSLLERSTLKVTCSVTNTNSNVLPYHGPASINFLLYAVIVEEGTFTIDNGHCNVSVGVLTQSDVLNSDASPMVAYSKHDNVYGSGSFWDDFKSGFNSVFNPVVDVATKLLPFAPLVGLGGNYGSGYDSDEGSGLTGGRRMSRKHLKRRM